jgi:enolase
VPLLNLLNGGRYGALRVDIQEYMLAPVGADSYAEALRMGVEVFYRLHELIRERYGAERLLTGHSAGDAAVSNEPEENIELLLEAAEGAGYGGRFRVALDCAASHFHDNETGLYRFRGRSVSRDELIRFLLDLLDRYPIFLVEDPLDEEDFEGFAEITRLARAGGAAGKAGRAGVLIAGDDLFVTSRARLERGIERGAANALIFKPNMVGTITEALDCALLARRSGYTLVPSVRAGGSVDDPIPDLAVALSAPLIKAGAPRSGERTSYHNRLMRIEEEGEGTIRLSPILG